MISDELAGDRRRLMKPTEVRLDHVPTWLAKRIRERIRPESGAAGWKLLELARQRADCDHGVIDHWGTTMLDGAEVFVSEPYLAPSHLAGARRLAKLLGLTLEVSPISWWFPGNTTRLIFTLKKEPKLESETDRSRPRGAVLV